MQRRSPLLELLLLVDDMLAHHRIVLLQFDLVGRVLLVLDRRVEMTGSGRRLKLDLFIPKILK